MRLVMPALVLLSSACTRTLWVGEYREDTAVAKELDGPITLEDTDDTDDTARLDDTAGDPTGCVVRVPDHVDLGAPVRGIPDTHFYVPDTSWALATAVAERKLGPVASHGRGVDPSPAGLFAIALESSSFGCGPAPTDMLHPPAAWARDPTTDVAGCLGLDRTGVWTELCRLYPEAFACDAYGDVISSTAASDRVEPGVLAAAHFVVVASVIQQQHGITDDWLAASVDPEVDAKLLAVALREGPWSPTFVQIATQCADRPVEGCIADGGTADFAVAVTAHRADLRAAEASGSCFDALLTADDVGAFVDDLAEVWPEVADSREAALAALVEGPFQQAAPAVLDVLARATPPLRCPADELASWYGIECP